MLSEVKVINGISIINEVTSTAVEIKEKECEVTSTVESEEINIEYDVFNLKYKNCYEQIFKYLTDFQDVLNLSEVSQSSSIIPII